MATPANRVPVRIARGTKANLDTAIAAGDLKEGEVCYATDENGLYVVEGGVLTQAGADLSTASIDALSDVDTTTAAPTDGQVLTWNNTASEWQPADAAGGATTLDELTDTAIPPNTFNVTGSGRFNVPLGTFPSGLAGEYYNQTGDNRLFISNLDADSVDMDQYFQGGSFAGKQLQVATDSGFTNIILDVVITVFSDQSGSGRYSFTYGAGQTVTMPTEVYVRVGEIVSGTTDGQVLTWNSANFEWRPQDAPGGAGPLSDLTDVKSPYSQTFSDVGQWDDYKFASPSSFNGDWALSTAGAGNRTLSFAQFNFAGEDRGSDLGALLTGATVRFTYDNVTFFDTTLLQDATAAGNIITLVVSETDGAQFETYSPNTPNINSSEEIFVSIASAGNPADGQVLTWVDANSQWEPVTPSGGGASLETARFYYDTNIKNPPINAGASYEPEEIGQFKLDGTSMDFAFSPANGYLTNNYEWMLTWLKPTSGTFWWSIDGGSNWTAAAYTGVSVGNRDFEIFTTTQPADTVDSITITFADPTKPIGDANTYFDTRGTRGVTWAGSAWGVGREVPPYIRPERVQVYRYSGKASIGTSTGANDCAVSGNTISFSYSMGGATSTTVTDRNANEVWDAWIASNPSVIWLGVNAVDNVAPASPTSYNVTNISTTANTGGVLSVDVTLDTTPPDATLYPFPGGVFWYPNGTELSQVRPQEGEILSFDYSKDSFVPTNDASVLRSFLGITENAGDPADGRGMYYDTTAEKYLLSS